ncbi:MAG TPA: dUTP diphosphatase [Xanthobacteraceae bacterium]|nr:dUTP diphosphatase [Xanthobacteraceae bacterium]
MSELSISFVQLPHAAGLPAPAYATVDAAGMDLSAAVEDGAPVTLAPGERAAIPTGIQLAIPQGYEGQVRPRSGLALKNAVTVLNAPGTIDADYRGEVKVILVNLGTAPFEIKRGMRIAQLVFAPVVRAALAQTASLEETARGEGGFGSTGIAKRAAG